MKVIRQKTKMREWQMFVENELNAVLRDNYPGYMDAYHRYRSKVGIDCQFVIVAARTMFRFEEQRREDFIERFKTGDWNGYS